MTKSLWIALDAAYSVVLRLLRGTGNPNPTSNDAAEYVQDISGRGMHWEKFFEEDYENRIRAHHPDNRFGAESIPQFLAVLLLTPSIDHLFDRGFIGFEDSGDLIISPVAHRLSLQKMGVETNCSVNVGQFTEGQRIFLDYHRNSVLLRIAR